MKQFKKIEISLPDSVAKELEQLAKKRNMDVSTFITSLTRRESARENQKEEEMAEGYRQMGEINLEWAESCLPAEEETLNWYEEKLSECEQE